MEYFPYCAFYALPAFLESILQAQAARARSPAAEGLEKVFELFESC
jgi:hypothetical protein